MTKQSFTLTINIAPDGTVDGLVEGIKGPSCGDVMKVLDGLGRVIEHRHTEEYNARPTLTNATARKNTLGRR